MIIAVSGQAGSGKDTAADFLVKNHHFVKVAFADPIKRAFLMIYPETPLEYLWGPSSLRAKPLLAYPREHGPWVEVPPKDAEMLTPPEMRCSCCNALYLDTKSEQCHLTTRYGLQKLGTEFGRDCYEQTWTDLFLDTAKILLSNDSMMYSQIYGLVERGPDVEYSRPAGVVVPDLRWPSENEGEMIRKSNGFLVRMKRGTGLQGGAGTHLSETAMQGVPDSFFDEVAHNEDWELSQLEAFMADVVQRRTTKVKNEQ